MITYSSIGLCQCCGVEGSVCECSNCHLQTHQLCNLISVKDSNLCVSCKRKQEKKPIPNCCLCSTEDPSLLVVCIAEDIYIHCTCLKALASYLYLDLDDEYVSTNNQPLSFSSTPLTGVSGQSFSSQFVTFFRDHFSPIKHQYRHLSTQFINFISSLFPLTSVNVYSFFSSMDNANHHCIYCNSNKYLLIKCQHKNCTSFCHFPCYLQHQSNQCFQVNLFHSSVCFLFYCDKHIPKQEEVEPSKPTTELSLPSAKTRLRSKKYEYEQQITTLLSSILDSSCTSFSFPSDPSFLLAIQDYSIYLHLDQQLYEWFHTSNKKSIVKQNSKSTIAISKPSSNHTCAICYTSLQKEIFPRLESYTVTCQSCQTTVHGFCANIPFNERKNWTCIRCSLKQTHKRSSCSVCQKKEGFLICVLLNNKKYAYHVPCYLQSLLYSSESIITSSSSTPCCSVCHNEGTSTSLFHCCIPDCNITCHYTCGDTNGGCFFFYPFQQQVYFFFVCSSHISSIPSFIRSFNSSSSFPSLSSSSLSSSLQTYLHPFRCCFSFSHVGIMNRQLPLTTLYSLLTVSPTQEFIPPSPVKKEKKEKLEKKEVKQEKKEKKEKKEVKSQKKEMKKEKKEKKEEKQPKSPKPVKEKKKEKRIVLSLQAPSLKSHSKSSTKSFDYSCKDVWKLVNTYFVKKMTKRDILSLLRLHPKYSFSISLSSNHIQLPPYSSILNTDSLSTTDSSQIVSLFPVSTVSLDQHIATRSTSTKTNESSFIFHGFEAIETCSCLETYTSYIDPAVISWFHSQHYCEDTIFRPATMEDIPQLLKVNTINPLYFKQEDFKAALSARNEFIIVAERINFRGKPVIVGLIHYYLIWYYPPSITSKHNKSSQLSVNESFRPQQIVYICTLQVLKETTHSQYLQKVSIQSEMGTGKLLFSLACQHGLKQKFKYCCLDSTKEAVSFYQDCFQMQKGSSEKNRMYIPLQLNLEQFHYHSIFNPKLLKNKKACLHCQLQVPEEEISSRFSNSLLHLQFDLKGSLLHSSLEEKQPISGIPEINSSLELLYTSSNHLELTAALSSLINYSINPSSSNQRIDISNHSFYLQNTTSDNKLLLNECCYETEWYYDELAIEIIRLIDELKECVKENYSLVNQCKEKILHEMIDEVKEMNEYHLLEKEYREYMETKKKNRNEKQEEEEEEEEEVIESEEEEDDDVKIIEEIEEEKEEVKEEKEEKEPSKPSKPSKQFKQSSKRLSPVEETEQLNPSKRNHLIKETKKNSSRRNLKNDKMCECISHIQSPSQQQYNKTIQLSFPKTIRKRIETFIHSTSFTNIFSPAEQSDSLLLHSYLNHYFKGIPKELLKETSWSIQTLLEYDRNNLLDLSTIVHSLQQKGISTTIMVSTILSLLFTSLFSVYPPHVIVNTSSSNHLLLARSPLIEVRKLSTLCNELTILISQFLTILQPSSVEQSACICEELTTSSSSHLNCISCHTDYHCSCLGLVPTGYSEMIQTRFWGYWTLERGFVCPRCCKGDLFEVSHSMKGVVQIRDSVIQQYQSYQNKKNRHS